MHEVIAGLIPPQAERASRAEIVTSAHLLAIAQRPTPRPVPQPIPSLRPAAVAQPRPLVRPHVATIAHGVPGRSGGAHSVPRDRPVWDVASGHALAATSLVGSGGSSGEGSSTAGNGNGAASADGPCGFVTFSDPHGSQYDPRTHGFYVDIRMSVHFADGTSQSIILDYPWYYASEAVNPWSDQNLKDSNFPTRFQPPPSNKVQSEPPLVQYVVAHSTSDGVTLLKDCPDASSTPAS